MLICVWVIPEPSPVVAISAIHHNLRLQFKSEKHVENTIVGCLVANIFFMWASWTTETLHTAVGSMNGIKLYQVSFCELNSSLPNFKQNLPTPVAIATVPKWPARAGMIPIPQLTHSRRPIKTLIHINFRTSCSTFTHLQWNFIHDKVNGLFVISFLFFWAFFSECQNYYSYHFFVLCSKLMTS